MIKTTKERKEGNYEKGHKLISHLSNLEPEAERLYPDRAPRRHRDHRDPGGYAAAGFEQGAGQGAADQLHGKHQTGRDGGFPVSDRL